MMNLYLIITLEEMLAAVLAILCDVSIETTHLILA
jgi:hypothetical protein